MADLWMFDGAASFDHVAPRPLLARPLPPLRRLRRHPVPLAFPRIQARQSVFSFLPLLPLLTSPSLRPTGLSPPRRAPLPRPRPLRQASQPAHRQRSLQRPPSPPGPRLLRPHLLLGPHLRWPNRLFRLLHGQARPRLPPHRPLLYPPPGPPPLTFPVPLAALRPPLPPPRPPLPRLPPRSRGGGCTPRLCVGHRKQVRAHHHQGQSLGSRPSFSLSSFISSLPSQTFTRTSEHTNLPPAFSLMSEFADVSDALFKLHLTPSTTLSTLLATPPFLAYLRSLSITDQPHERPQSVASYVAQKPTAKRVLLDINLPGPQHAKDILPLVDAVFALVDLLAAGKVVLRPETRAKIRKVREDVEKEIKEDEIKEKKEEVRSLFLHHLHFSHPCSRLPKIKKPPNARPSKIGLQSSAPPSRKRSRSSPSRLLHLSYPDHQVLDRTHKRAVRKSQGKVVRKA